MGVSFSNRGKDWNLTKVVWTFSPAEMQDLEFTPAIPTLAPMMSEKYGGAAAQLLAQFGDDALPTLRDPHREIRQEASGCLSNHESTNRTSFYLGLLNDPDPNVRAHALGIAAWINRMSGSDEVSARRCRC